VERLFGFLFITCPVACFACMVILFLEAAA
jgi:hypothetical protein